MNIGIVAERVSLPTSTIRYYESIGLLPAPERKSGRRVYTEDVIDRLRMIQLSKHAGWSLDEIRLMFDAQSQGGHFSEAWRGMAQQKLAELDHLIAQIEQMKTVIHSGLSCNCTSPTDCAMLKEVN